MDNGKWIVDNENMNHPELYNNDLRLRPQSIVIGFGIFFMFF